jgi:hypothetical protein
VTRRHLYGPATPWAVIGRRAVLGFGASGAGWVAPADLGCCSDMVALWRYLVFIILA